MSEMIDRVAQAIMHAEANDPDGRLFSTPVRGDIDAIRTIAKAAIGAMKEPSQRMMYAGGFFHIQGGDAVSESDANAARRTYRAMIDAILVGGA